MPIKSFRESRHQYREASINDDRDMLQEMKLVLRAHRVPGMIEEDVAAMSQVLRMATLGGARATPFASSIGTLEVGKAADLVLIAWKQICYPCHDAQTPLLDAVTERGKAEGVKLTMSAARRGHQALQG